MDSSELEYDQSIETANVNNGIEDCGEIISNSNSENMELTEDVIQNSGECDVVRSSKRNRQIDQDEMWTNITRRGKRFARTSHVHDEIRIPEDKIEISITSIEKLPKQFGLAKLLKTENILDITSIKYINAFKVLIQFSIEESANKLIESKCLKEKGLRCQKTLEIRETYGVIKNIDLESSEEEILDGLSCDTEIIGIKRLKRRNTNSGQWEPGETVRVTFKGSSLPSYVYIFDTRVKVNPYQFPVTQCSRCWRYGHTVKVCSSIKEICPKCSKSHPNCDTTSYKCNNCAGKHMALARTCPMYLKERRLRELMSEFNCTYKRALTLYVPPEPNYEEYSEEREQETEKEQHQLLSQETNVEMIPMSQPQDTYANTLKKAKSLKSKAKKKTTLIQEDTNKNDGVNPKNKQTTDTAINWAALSDSDSEIQHVEIEKTDNSSKKKEKSWKWLWNKLKEKIWDSGTSLENKVFDCVKVIFEWLTSFMMDYITDLPFLSNIKQWIITTNTDT